jgi:hypothetical protein
MWTRSIFVFGEKRSAGAGTMLLVYETSFGFLGVEDITFVVY